MVELALTAASNCAFNRQRYGRIAEPSGLGVAPQATLIKMIRLTSTLKDGRLRGFFAT